MSKQGNANTAIAKLVLNEAGDLDLFGEHMQLRTAANIGYVQWKSGSPRATLEGQFTLEQLRAIASHMEKHGGGK